MAISEVCFNQTVEDLASTRQSLVRGGEFDEALRRAWPTPRSANWIAVVGALATLGLLRLPDALQHGTGALMLSGVSGIAAFFWVRRSANDIDDRPRVYAARVYSDRRCPAWLAASGPTTARIDENGFTVADTSRSQTYRWAGVTKVKTEEIAVLIGTLFGETFSIPISAFHDDQAATHFAQEARRLSKEANGLDALIVGFLRGHDLTCSKCGYSLRGIPEPKCPECARPIRFADLGRATEARG